MTFIKDMQERAEKCSTDILQGARCVTGNQWPDDSQQYGVYQSGFENALAMVYIELAGTPKTKGKLDTLIADTITATVQHIEGEMGEEIKDTDESAMYAHNTLHQKVMKILDDVKKGV